MSRPKVNLRSTAVKRIMQEAAELSSADIEDDGFVAAPLEDDIFEWHCTMRGVANSEYDGGLYHLRILLPPSYPMSAPDIMLMTPNGRFELGKKICIDGLTSFHAGSWQPAWGVRTAVVGLRSFWMQGGEALSAIGALDYSKEERKRLARLSTSWKCPSCGMKNEEIIPATPAAPVPAPAIPSKSSASSSGSGGGRRYSLGETEAAQDWEAKDNKGKGRLSAHNSNDGEVTSTGASESGGRGDGRTKQEEQDLISVDPDPAEVPTLIPPPLSLPTGSMIGPSATTSQILPVDFIPPALATGPQPQMADSGLSAAAKGEEEVVSNMTGATITRSGTTSPPTGLDSSSINTPESTQAPESTATHSTAQDQPAPPDQRSYQPSKPSPSPPVPVHQPITPHQIPNHTPIPTPTPTPTPTTTLTPVRPAPAPPQLQTRSRSLKALDTAIVFLLTILFALIAKRLSKDV